MDSNQIRRLYERSSHQLGLVTRDDLTALEVTRHQREWLQNRGEMVLAGHRTYRLVGAPTSTRQQLLVACLDHDGLASHRAAAWTHGLHGFVRMHEPEVMTRRPHRHATCSVTVHTTTWLPDDDVVAVGPIPATSVARTLFGLAGLVPAVSITTVRDAVDVAVRDGKASDAWLWWRLERLRCRGRNGVRVFESILLGRQPDHRVESWLEREFLRLLEDAGLPLPVCQRRIDHNGAFVARVDFLYPALRLVIEVSGHQTHSSRAERTADLRRDNRLMLSGYRKLEFSYDDVVRRPVEVVATVAAALRAARAA